MPILLMLPLFLLLIAVLVFWWLSDRFKFTYHITGIIILAAGTLLLLVGLCSVYFDWKEHSCLAGRALFNALPGPILLLTGLWLMLAKRFQGAVKLVGLSVAIPLTAIMMFCISFQAYLGPHRSRVSYKFFFSRYKNTPYKRVISHFPKNTPENAKDVRYFHQSHFMMGGMLLQLRFVLPKGEIESSLAESLGKAKQVQETDGDYITSFGPNDLVIPRLRAGERGYVNWPKGYKIMTFDGKSGNHGFGYGVAISIERNEVVYWAEYW